MRKLGTPRSPRPTTRNQLDNLFLAPQSGAAAGSVWHPPLAMSETSSLKFKTAYDEAKSTIAASLDAVKTTYDTINRDLSDEIKAADKERKELNAGLAKANKEIDSLKSTVSGLEISLSSSKELASATHKSLEVRTRAIGQSARTPTISP